ncbi:nuclear transport factor 2 family protein [Novosphingobium sp. M1R2S20]|uniref:Nuclear transport factor 2 family protein n=1 Tax=Novosphingobium rhizovicinum TaxID=3228928 RepID=A0ABV3R915_9SPHN
MTSTSESPGTEIAIRTRRAAFNRAIADGDVAAIGSILARDCVMLTGTDSAVIAGRLAQVKVWKREFAAPHRDIYVRAPEAIDISAIAPIAMEHGTWDAISANGQTTATGTYAAKWREVAGEWVIEAEVFVTLA